MFNDRSIAVVIPAYNEGSHVRNVIESVPGFVDRIYAVDDASTDDTWGVIRETAAAHNTDEASTDGRRIVPVHHERNRGAGGTVVTGYRRALADGYDVIAVMDGDGQMDPRMLDRIVEPVASGSVGYAKGDRLRRPAHRSGMSPWRQFGNLLLTQLTRVASGYWTLSDAQNGYTAISASTLGNLDLDELYTDYGFLNHLLVHLHRNRVRIADVEHPCRYGTEQSGIRYRQFVPGLSWLLLQSALTRYWHDHVIDRTGPASVAYPLFGVSVLVVLGGLWRTFFTEVSPTLILGTIAFVLIACVSLFAALFDDCYSRETLVETYANPVSRSEDESTSDPSPVPDQASSMQPSVPPHIDGADP